jgi:outer membrane protein assembly factor BamE (lipoprotein component of BamABCDE complex)
MKFPRLTALALALALTALTGCFFPEKSRPVLIEAYHLPELHGLFMVGSTSRDDVIAAIGPPSSVDTGQGGQERWLYYPRRTETVYIITLRSSKGDQNFKFAPSNGQTLSLVFRNGRLAGF